MKPQLDVASKNESSVDVLKDYIADISVKSLDNNWIQDNKIDLDLLMADNHSDISSKASSRLFHNNLD